MNPSQRWRSVRATVYTWATALTVTGTPKMLVDSMPDTTKGPAVRWSLAPVSEVLAAVDSQGDHTLRNTALLIADVFWPAPSSSTSIALSDIDQAVDDLRDALTLVSLRFKDDTATPGTPTDLPYAHQIRSFGPPTFTVLPTLDGYSRARIAATVVWDAYRTA